MRALCYYCGAVDNINEMDAVPVTDTINGEVVRTGWRYQCMGCGDKAPHGLLCSECDSEFDAEAAGAVRFCPSCAPRMVRW